jgi:hypothetical protein
MISSTIDNAISHVQTPEFALMPQLLTVSYYHFI